MWICGGPDADRLGNRLIGQTLQGSHVRACSQANADRLPPSRVDDEPKPGQSAMRLVHVQGEALWIKRNLARAGIGLEPLPRPAMFEGMGHERAGVRVVVRGASPGPGGLGALGPASDAAGSG
jgi:hypothetical protein